jgi:hypothetical protein
MKTQQNHPFGAWLYICHQAFYEFKKKATGRAAFPVY